MPEGAQLTQQAQQAQRPQRLQRRRQQGQPRLAVPAAAAQPCRRAARQAPRPRGLAPAPPFLRRPGRAWAAPHRRLLPPPTLGMGCNREPPAAGSSLPTRRLPRALAASAGFQGWTTKVTCLLGVGKLDRQQRSSAWAGCRPEAAGGARCLLFHAAGPRGCCRADMLHCRPELLAALASAHQNSASPLPPHVPQRTSPRV